MDERMSFGEAWLEYGLDGAWGWADSVVVLVVPLALAFYWLWARKQPDRY